MSFFGEGVSSLCFGFKKLTAAGRVCPQADPEGHHSSKQTATLQAEEKTSCLTYLHR